MLRQFFILFVVLIVCNSNLEAQANLSEVHKSFSIFKIDDISKMKGLEPILKDNTDLEMVRFDYSTKIIFIVSKSGITLENTYLANMCGAYFQDIKCIQIGSLGIDIPDFEKVKNCN